MIITQPPLSALYVDIDNIAGGFVSQSPLLAERFVNHPAEWLAALTEGRLPGDHPRRFAVRRAYLNPEGYIKLNGHGETLPLHRVRRPLIEAGFEVVDCPPLTVRSKNGADIRMALDVQRRMLTGPIQLEECVLASSDADFTPVLHELRNAGVHSCVVTSGAMSRAYGHTPDQVLQLYSDKPNQIKRANDEVVEKSHPKLTSADLVLFLNAELAESTGPIPLAKLGKRVHRVFGTTELRATKWHGKGGLRAFIDHFGNDLATDKTWVWNPALHTAPRGTEAVILPGRW